MLWLCSDIVDYCINARKSDGSNCSNNNITMIIRQGCGGTL